MTRNEHNGWTNYETWCVNLWIDNEQGSQEQAAEMAREALQDAIDRDDDKAEAVSTLAQRLEEMHDECRPEVSGVFVDLLNAALSEVNWREIAQHYVDDIDVYSAGWNMPGYMPDNAPAMFLDADDAREYIANEIERADEESEDEDTAEEVQDACNEATEAAQRCRTGAGEFGETVGAYHYFVTKV